MGPHIPMTSTSCRYGPALPVRSLAFYLHQGRPCRMASPVLIGVARNPLRRRGILSCSKDHISIVRPRHDLHSSVRDSRSLDHCTTRALQPESSVPS